MDFCDKFQTEKWQEFVRMGHIVLVDGAVMRVAETFVEVEVVVSVQSQPKLDARHFDLES